jgi:enoyl-CoA hydratase
VDRHPSGARRGERVMGDDVRAGKRGRVLEIVLNRPDAGNAATDAMAAELTTILRAPAEDVDVIVLRAAGSDFCIGRETMGRARLGAPEALERRRRTEVIFDCYGAFRAAELPIVGVVQGRAEGFGCALAGLCDVTIAADTATFRIPEMAHKTLPTMVMSALVDRVPRKGLTYLVYSTESISAERALTLGLVSEVVPAGELETHVDRVLATMLRTPRPALLGLKEFARSAFELSTQGATDLARNVHATINSSSEMGRGADAPATPGR